jgi:hypothetical protein
MILGAANQTNLTGMYAAVAATALDQQPDPPFYNSTNGTVPATFKLNNRRTDPDSAESYCNDVGGHLVQYTSQEEQHDVERFYIYGVGARPAGLGQV